MVVRIESKVRIKKIKNKEVIKKKYLNWIGKVDR